MTDRNTAGQNVMQDSEQSVMAEKTLNRFFFQNTSCPYFPCHKTQQPENFNCMFCYCPLYMLGDKCGGNFKILSNGIKDCSECVLLHTPNAVDNIFAKFDLIKKIENANRDLR